MKNKKLIIFLSIAIVALAGVGVGLYFYFNSPKRIFVRSLTNTINEIREESENRLLYNLKYDTLKVTTKTTGSLSMNTEKYDIAVNGDFAYDKVAKKVNANLGILGNNQSIVDLNAALDNTKVYFQIKDLMKNFYFVDTGVDFFNTIDQKDLDYLLDIVKNTFFGELTDKDFTKSSEKVELDNTVSVTKLDLKLDEKRVKEIIEKVLESVKGDKKAISIIQKLSKDFKETDIDKAIESMKKVETSNKDYLLYSVYVKGNNIVRHEFSSNLEGSVANKYKLVINDYTNKSGYKNRDFIVMDNSKEVGRVAVKGTSKNKYELSITSDMVTASGTMIKDKEKESVDLSVSASGMQLGTLSYSVAKSSSTQYDFDMKIDFNVLTYKLNLVSNNKLLLNEKVEALDVSNSKDSSTMTEQEQATIITAIYTRLAKAFPSLMK